jgi:hypothetical protein
MTSNQINQAFLNATDSKTKNEIIASIANHYGITEGEAMAEVIEDGAEHLLDYLTGSTRTATSLLMKRYSCYATA